VGLFDERTGGLVSYWKSVPAITSRVGAGVDAKIAPDAPKEKWSGQFLVYTRGPGGTVHRHLGGSSGVRTSIVHVYCYGDTRADADALAEDVKVRTQNQRGLWGNTYVQYVFIDDPPDDGSDSPIDGSQKVRFWTRVVMRIMHSEN
jgi:hypothetical protein